MQSPLKLCVLCRAYLPVENFDRAPHDFPTRDGFNHCCRNHQHKKWRKLADGRVELIESEENEDL